jgi:hypothetical protein
LLCTTGFLSTLKPDVSPTYQQVRQTCDTTITFTANHILEKLYFKDIISSAIDPKLKRPPVRIAERSLRFLPLPKSGDYIIPGESLQVVTVTEPPTINPQKISCRKPLTQSYNLYRKQLSKIVQVSIQAMDCPIAISICNLLHRMNTDPGGNPRKNWKAVIL